MCPAAQLLFCRYAARRILRRAASLSAFRSLAFFERHIAPALGNARIGGADDLARVDELLHAVRAPARHARDGEDGRVELHGDVQKAVPERGK